MKVAVTTTASNQSYLDNIGKGLENILKIYSCKNFLLNFWILIAILSLLNKMNGKLFESKVSAFSDK